MPERKAKPQSKPCCGLCGSREKLTRTPCCGNWICDDADQYVAFSFARNSCYTNHSKFTICSGHHHEKHEGRWQDCSKCKEGQPLEMYVYLATNEYNFEKLENPPAFEPTQCNRCGVRVRLAYDGYTLKGDEIICASCSASEMPGTREFMEGLVDDQTSERPATEYPVGTLAYYGPTNRLATKLVASIIKRPDAGPDPLHRWITQVGDIRDDKSITQQVSAFYRRHRVKEIASLHRIMGCPHEEGKDYPEGEECPHCPFWKNRDRLTHDLLPEGGMSPAEIVTELSEASPKRQPIEALTAAETYREELVPVLLRALERGVEQPKGTPTGEAMLFSYATYLLAKWREPRAYPLFIRWLSLPGEEAYDLGGDAVSEDGPVLLASVCGGDIEPIKELILNRQANEYCRAKGIEALCVLVAWKELPHQTVSDYFLWLAREGLEREPSYAWDALANCSADIEAIDVFPEIHRAYDEELASPSVMTLEELDAVRDGPRGKMLSSFRELHRPIHDVAKATAWWQCFANDQLRTFETDASKEKYKSMTTPEPIRATPKVGRNEPCPCGSGKKYKKCCGAN